jgi:hypothetical protein
LSLQAEVGEGNSMRVEEAQDVMVRPHQELHRSRIRLVVGQDGRVHVTVRRYERQVRHLLVQIEGHLSECRFRR